MMKAKRRVCAVLLVLCTVFSCLFPKDVNAMSRSIREIRQGEYLIDPYLNL